MNGSSSPQSGEPPADIDPREARFIAFLEGDLGDKEQAEFRAELDRDDQLRQQFDEFAQIMGGMQSVPIEFAPPDFVDDVRRQIRSRSRGQFFADSFLYSTRMPYEAIAVVMIAVMAAAWMLMGVPKDRRLRDADIRVQPQLKTTQQTPKSP